MNKTSKLHMHRLLVRGKRQKQRETKLIVAATNNILVRNKLLRMDFTRKRIDRLYYTELNALLWLDGEVDVLHHSLGNER